MCLAKTVIWTCHRCGVNIMDPDEPPVQFCFTALINEKCSRASVSVVVACDPALCLYCGFHKQDMYYEVEKRVWDMSLGRGLLGPRRVKYFWGLDPAPVWESFETAEQERLANGEWRCAERNRVP